MNQGIGDRFQAETKYSRKNMYAQQREIIPFTELYKNYPKNMRIPLPPPKNLTNISLHDVLTKRKSIRTFSHKPLTLEQISSLLWATTGIQRIECGYEFRTEPSAGALYPIETYLMIDHVTDVSKGMYHYAIKNHYLEQLRPGDFKKELTDGALGQEMCLQAAVIFIWTAVVNRSKWKYGQRAYRYIYLDAGHIAENLALYATSMGLGSCHIGALFDDDINAIIEVDGVNESIVYMTVVGHPY